MTHNKLQLNDSKTESMLVKSHRLSVNFPLPSSMRIGNSEVLFVSSVKIIGVTLDCNLNMTQHVLNICRSAYIELRQIGSIRHLLTAQATQTLVYAFILSRLDYCNCLLAGCPQFLIDRLQKVQNAAARLICRAKKLDHVQPILQSLHWLPIRARIQYKISTLCFNVITGTGPQYLSELLHLYTPSRDLRSSADTRILKIPRSNSKAFGQRSFSHVGPSTWNGLPYTLRHSDSQTSFRQALKTHLFQQSF